MITRKLPLLPLQPLAMVAILWIGSREKRRLIGVSNVERRLVVQYNYAVMTFVQGWITIHYIGRWKSCANLGKVTTSTSTFAAILPTLIGSQQQLFKLLLVLLQQYCSYSTTYPDLMGSQQQQLFKLLLVLLLLTLMGSQYQRWAVAAPAMSVGSQRSTS